MDLRLSALVAMLVIIGPCVFVTANSEEHYSDDGKTLFIELGDFGGFVFIRTEGKLVRQP